MNVQSEIRSEGKRVVGIFTVIVFLEYNIIVVSFMLKFW